MFPFRPYSAPLAAVLLAAATAAAAQPAPDAVPPPDGPPPVPTSNYSDGTGDSAVDALNASQLDGNYRGPRYVVQPGTSQPVDGGTPPAAVAPYAVSRYPATRPVTPIARRLPASPPSPSPPVPAAAAPPDAAPSAIYPAGPPPGR